MRLFEDRESDFQAHVISESEELKNLEYIRKGLDELPVSIYQLMTSRMQFTLDRVGTGHLDRRLSSRTRSITPSHGVKW